MRPTKKDELIEKALLVFYDNGFHASGMDLIANKTGISKTSIYKHFRTKDDLIIAALKRRDDDFRDWFYQRIKELADTPKGQLIAMFDALEEWFETPGYRGCMFIKASSEFQDPKHPIHIASADHKRALEKHLIALAEKAGISNPAVLVRQLLLLKEGAIVTAHLGYVKKPALDAKQAAVALVNAA